MHARTHTHTHTHTQEKAIFYAWDLLTRVYKLPKDRLYVTYFGGSDKYTCAQGRLCGRPARAPNTLIPNRPKIPVRKDQLDGRAAAPEFTPKPYFAIF